MTSVNHSTAPVRRTLARLKSGDLLGPLALLVVTADILVGCFASLATKPGGAWAIVASARIALPLFLTAFLASPLAELRPGAATRWLLRSRRSFGLAFAVALGCHLTFVSLYASQFGLKLSRPALLADTAGAAFTAALTITSLRPIMRRLPRKWWKRLHTTGIYVVWLLVLYIYQAEVRGDRDPIAILAFSTFLLAGALRVLCLLRAPAA